MDEPLEVRPPRALPGPGVNPPAGVSRAAAAAQGLTLLHFSPQPESQPELHKVTLYYYNFVTESTKLVPQKVAQV